MSGDLRTTLLETMPADVPDLDVDRLVRRGTRRRRAKRAGAAVAVLVLLTTGSVAVLGPPPADRIPVISQEEPQPEEPAPTAGEWQHLPTAPMSERARTTVATDGDLVAIFGGAVGGTFEVGGTTYGEYMANDGAIYDASGHAWSAIPPAPLPPRAGSNLFLAGGQLMVIGGLVLEEAPQGGVLTGDPTVTLDSLRFDLAKTSWERLGAPDIEPRTPDLVTWDGTRLVLWGGVDPEDASFMDGATWTATEGWRLIPEAPLEARSGAAVAVAGDRLVVWGGARNRHPELDDVFADGAVFDLTAWTWEPIPEGPLVARTIGQRGWPNQGNVRVDGDRVLIVGGSRFSGTYRHDGAWLDLTDGSWTTIAPAPVEALYAVARPGGVIAVDDNSRGDEPYVTLWRYDEDGDRWERTATRLPEFVEVHHVSAERIVVSSRSYGEGPGGAPRIGIWDADAPHIVHAHPPLSDRQYAAIAPLPDGVLVWGGEETEADGSLRMVGDGARLDR